MGHRVSGSVPPCIRATAGAQCAFPDFIFAVRCWWNTHEMDCPGILLSHHHSLSHLAQGMVDAVWLAASPGGEYRGRRLWAVGDGSRPASWLGHSGGNNS